MRIMLGLLFFALFFSGCNDSPTSVATEKKPATAVSSQLQHLFDSILKLVEEDVAKTESYETDFKAWKDFRAVHCQSLHETSSGVETARTTCEAAMDLKKIAELNRLKLDLLLRLPPVEQTVMEPGPVNVEMPDALPRKVALFSPNKNLAAIGQYDGRIEIYDLVSSLRLYVGQPEKTYSLFLDFSPNSRILATSSTGRGLVFMDAVSGEEYLTVKRIKGRFALFGDGRYVLWSNGREMVLSDALSDAESVKPLQGNDYAERVFFAKQRPLAMVATRKGNIELWEVNLEDKANPLEFKDVAVVGRSSTTKLLTGAFKPDGSVFYSIHKNGGLQSWSVPTLRTRREAVLQGEPAGSMKVSPDGTILLPMLRKEQRNRTIFMFDPESRKAAYFDMTSDGIIGLTPYGASLLLANSTRVFSREPPQLNEMVPLPSSGEITRRQPKKKKVLSPPAVLNLEKNVRVEAIGVYEGQYVTRTAPGRRRLVPGTVDVEIGDSTQPLVLVLSSYEAVNWKIRKMGNTEIKYVLLSGYHGSSIDGLSRVNIVRIGRASCYKRNGKGYHRLEQEVREYSGKGIDQFQGGYAGKEFSIGTVRRSRELRGVYQSQDSNGTRVFSDRSL